VLSVPIDELEDAATKITSENANGGWRWNDRP
jgi:hypothetical protein